MRKMFCNDSNKRIKILIYYIMTETINIPLLILDFLVLLPVTILRLVIIYLYGSKYNIELLDVIMHADGKYFNGKSKSINTIKKDMGNVIKSMIDKKNKPKINIKKEESVIKSSVDEDIEKLTNMINNLVNKRKNIKKQDKKDKFNEYSEVSIKNKINTENTESITEDEFSFMFSEDKKLIN